jgi:hypothetical protein
MARAVVDELWAFRRRQREMLLIACFVTAASLVLEVQNDTDVALAGLPEVVAPPLCVSREWFGVRCPGCGLTRSFIHLAHGRWDAAWHAHRLGWLLALLVLLQFPYRICQLRRLGRPIFSTAARGRFSKALITVLIVNWALEVLTGMPL